MQYPGHFLQGSQGQADTRAPRAQAPQGKLELDLVEEPTRAGSGQWEIISVTVIERQALVTHVLTLDALGACGHTDHFGVLQVRTSMRRDRAGSILCIPQCPPDSPPRGGRAQAGTQLDWTVPAVGGARRVGSTD